MLKKTKRKVSKKVKLHSGVGAEIKAGGKQEGTNSVKARRKDRGYFVSFSLPILPTTILDWEIRKQKIKE